MAGCLSTISATSRSTNWGEVASNDYEGKDRSERILGEPMILIYCTILDDLQDFVYFVVQAGKFHVRT